MVKRLAPWLVLVLVVAAALVTWGWSYQGRPLTPADLALRATLEQVDQATADATVPGGAVAGPADEIFLGRVTWQRPVSAPEGSSLRIVVLDKRNDHLPRAFTVTSPRPGAVRTGYDSTLNEAARRYEWLWGAGMREAEGAYYRPGTAIRVTSLDASPVTFSTVLRPVLPGTPARKRAASSPAEVSDLLLAVIHVGPDGRIVWAEKLLS